MLTQVPVQWVLAFFRGGKAGGGVKFTAFFYVDSENIGLV